ncbi:myosin heavy chain, embryonic smooth muscle isoform isoform X4 [Amia ocellicauda]|uniref:myosin heavy chain, embryonic smooth muscle isoform isoform X4 n=1 Tax=Amia ocellicauda TaxID=2972642 RepID=UPI003464BD75
MLSGSIQGITISSRKTGAQSMRMNNADTPPGMVNDVPLSLLNLKELLEKKVEIFQKTVSKEEQKAEAKPEAIFSKLGCLQKYIVQSREFSIHFRDLNRETEQEVIRVGQRLRELRKQQEQLGCELKDLDRQLSETVTQLQRNHSIELVRVQQLTEEAIARKEVQVLHLKEQEEDLTALQAMLGEDVQRYEEEANHLQNFSDKLSSEMEGDSQSRPEKSVDSDKQPENFPTNTRASQSAKYQLLQDSEVSLNHLKGTDGRVAENGRDSHWENNGTSPYLGLTYSIDRQSSRLDSLDSTGSRDWDSISDRMSGIDSPSRVFNSPYKTPSLDYDRINRISEYKSMPVLSPATSEISLFNSRSSSPVPSPTMLSPRSRFTAYDTWNKQRAVMTSLPALRPGVHNKRDYIEELTRLLDNCQKRNQFLEAESVEMNKERNQIRFEMRGLLVSNEDMLRTNTQLQGELKRVMDRVVELERENTMLNDRFAHMESELSQAREVMVEANAQEYAFNYLQQSLKNKIQDAEENMEKQNQQTQDLSEKLWLTERKMEELETEKQNQDKIIVDLRNKVLRLETELGEALQISTQSTAELNLFQKLKNDSQQRVADLEENLLQRTQELQKAQMIVNRLQGEVSGKLIDKERSLEEEIQLRERLQLQCKQAERSLEDLQMEVQTAVQAKEDIAKHLKLAQEKMIELESDLEEMHDNEQRWAVKNKRAQEQMDQLQLKLIQERDLREQLDCEKVMLERQIRDLRVEVHELQNSKVQEDVMSRAELRVKELENSLRTEERNKIILTNNIGKLERKIKELTDQVEEEHRLAEEQKDLMTQRMRTLKRQLNEAEEEMSRKETQFRLSQRELSEEREAISRLQRQLLDQQVQIKRNESLKMRQALDNFRLDLDSQDEEEGSSKQQPTHFI